MKPGGDCVLVQMGDDADSGVINRLIQKYCK